MTVDSSDNKTKPTTLPLIASAAFDIGDVVKHRMFEFRGVIYDVDPVFSNSEEWWDSIPEQYRPAKDQPYYHLYAENPENSYVAYVSQQNLLFDADGGPVTHPAIPAMFESYDDGKYVVRPARKN